MENKYMLLMALGCGIPLLAVLLLSNSGLSKETLYFIGFIAMFGMHFLMMGNHNHNQGQNVISKDQHKHGVNQHEKL